MTIFSSGLNNVSHGNGRGYLYVLNALTGKPLSFSPIAAGTPASNTDETFGSVTTPSNLGKINAWIHTDTDNTTRRIYGGDMLGNLWRFDMDDRIEPKGHEAIRLGVAKDSAGKIQPITSRPLLTAMGARPGDDRSLVSFGTGKYLHGKDLEAHASTSKFSNQQSLYFVSDDTVVNKDSAASLRASLTQRTTETAEEVDFTTSSGFYLDLSEARERVNLDGLQFNGMISFASTVPDAKDPCQSGGHSNLYYFTRKGQLKAIERLTTLVVGGSRLFNPIKGKRGDGSNGGKFIWTCQDASICERDVEGPESGSGGTKVRRAAWRELID